jgi:DNA-binding transcriptional ArsR family regulator
MQTVLDHDRIFGALGDPTRRDIVRRAIDANEGIAELASHYPMSFAAVQKHVAILERAGLVTKERTGRRKVVRANVEGLRAARLLLDRYGRSYRHHSGVGFFASPGHPLPPREPSDPGLKPNGAACPRGSLRLT